MAVAARPYIGKAVLNASRSPLSIFIERGHRPRRWRGMLTSALGWAVCWYGFWGLLVLFVIGGNAVLLAILPIFVSLDSLPENFFLPFFLMFLIALPSVVVPLFGPALIERGRQMRAKDAVTMLTKESRAPVLYLRSFEDDDLLDPTLASMFSIYIFRFRPPFVRNRYESGLTSTLRQLGPVICIGKPGEIYPEIGAARIYVSDAHWKDAVEYFFKHAAAVIFTVGRTESLWWEINTALSVVSLDRLLFFFPFAEKVGTRGSLFRRYWAFIGLGLTTRKMLDRMETERRARYELFRKSIQSFLPKSLPDTLGKSLFIDFSGDGTARLLQTKRPIDKAIVWSFSNVSWTQVSFRRTLKSFFEKFHQ